MSTLDRVRKWDEFKRLVKELKPDSIVYSIDQNAMSKTKDLTALRLILLAKDGYWLTFIGGADDHCR